MNKILMIDDDHALGRSFQIQLEEHGMMVTHKATGQEGVEALDGSSFDILFLDLKLPDMNGLSILKAVQKSHPELPVVIISGRQDMEATIDAIKFGAFDYIRKPFDIDDILLILEKVRIQKGHRDSAADSSFSDPVEWSSRELVGNTPEMLEILKQIGLLSRTRVPVLVTGESGTGKELVARAIHQSSCPDKPFVAVNCSAVVPTLLESELFGHEKGAFTGADKQKMGKLEAAGDGIMFFDEIGDMPFDLQSKLLRVLQEQEFERVGGLRPVPFRARPVFATHCNLSEMVQNDSFRQDLYYRIAVVHLSLPSLRKRKRDIKIISLYLLTRIGRTQGAEIAGIQPQAVEKLCGHDWPGNVRELENVLTRAVALSQSGTITANDIIFDRSLDAHPSSFKPVSLSAAEKEHIRQSLAVCSWNIAATSRQLEISPTTLRKKIRDYRLMP